ncbi:uncharacterized protein N7459_008010 [Penicillium hispanicum]|uniref:uncharacterized protein n=1 Tax=Penicillium hispanicum TaxID=1080232 RepID=UPI00254180DC|nr:uncharacterized protein N7459_008010 [Penicillium hispanicum]KAJ5573583.1 hypothetical protein N7459_008010 [Penicillium hispanicum]
MKFLSFALVTVLAAFASAAALDQPLEKRCTENYEECSSASECCSGNCGNFNGSEFHYCAPKTS